MTERIYEQKQREDVECPVYYNISGSANELISEDGHLITENGKNNNKKTHTDSYVLCYLHQTSTANMA